jgi:prevent-host-death family protein
MDRTHGSGYIDSHLLESKMSSYSVAEAKNTLPKLIDRALEGEEVIITRRGKPVVELRPASVPPEPPVGSDEWLFERTRSRPRINISSVDLLNMIYESDEE